MMRLNYKYFLYINDHINSFKKGQIGPLVISSTNPFDINLIKQFPTFYYF